MSAEDAAALTDAEWKKKLSREQYHILREKGTEMAYSGKYDKYYPTEGHFACAGCGNPLYSSKAKFDSGCGWPAFDRCYASAVKTKIDNSFGMQRIEDYVQQLLRPPRTRICGRARDRDERTPLRQ